MNTSEAIAAIRTMATARAADQPRLIREFCGRVWAEGMNATSESAEILRGLAYVLDFYEPDRGMRAENGSYFEDSHLRLLLMEVLEKLEHLHQHE